MKKTALALFALITLSISFAHAAAFLPDKAAIGYPYNFNASLGNSYKTIPCLLSAKDKFGTSTQSWNTDYNGLLLMTDTKGNLVSYVVPNNAFVVGENYSFTLACSDVQNTQAVAFEVGGTSGYNIFFLNSLEYFNARPDDSILIGILAIAGLLIVIAIAGAIFGGRKLWG